MDPSVSRQFDLACTGAYAPAQSHFTLSGRRRMSAHHTPEEIRKGLTHPVIDGDGHWVEYTPVFAEQIRKVTGDLGANGFLQSQRRIPDALSMTLEQRTERGVAMEGFWGRQSTNTRDRATAMMPRMLYDRLGELGIDFGIVYPTAGLGIPRIADDATRRAVIRGFNVVTHEYFKDLGDKLTPAAVIPVHTPDEAIEELEFVTKQLGAKVCMFRGGVTRRFPDLRFAFLEGGVGWGCQLFCDLIEHWERRGAKGMANMDPTKLNRPLLRELVDKYGYADIAAELGKRDGWPLEEDFLTGGMPPDDYIHCHITQKQDWIDLYAAPYYFGCEADDRMNAVAFGKAMPLGARINAIYSSDIGHFDVVDMRDPLPEAFELVEGGLITESDFQDFVFGNAVRLWGTQNPRFFEGTAVAKEAAALLKRGAPALRDAAKIGRAHV